MNRTLRDAEKFVIELHHFSKYTKQLTNPMLQFNITLKIMEENHEEDLC